MQTNILDYLDSTVQKMPDKIAFKDDDSSISFITLKKQSKSIASYLINHIDTCKPVIVFNEKNVFTPVCFISVLYSGCFYVPIDTQLPKLRIEKILSIVNAEIMITDRKNIDKAKTLNYSGKIILIEDVVNTEIEEIKLDKIRQQNIDTDPIYIIFTSGSSGTPKGVVVSHRSLIDYIDVFTYITKIDENDVMANQTPFDYDGSVRDIYSTLKTGATTYIVPIKYFSTPLKLFEVLIEHKVTSLSWAVSALVIPVLMNIFTERVPLSIKRVMFSGSVMPCKYLSIWQKYLPDAMYINQYGPTECTGTSTYYIVPGKVSEDDILPIGKPYPNTKIILLNEDRKCVPHGEIGEIYISGTCLSKGYYNNHEKTMEVFIQNPINQYYPEILYKTGDLGRIRSDGILEFHGRNDSQIKYMGHRIELGEIESTALKKQEISRCSCLYQESKEMIWLFYVGDTDNKELSIYLRNLLPSFMIPRKFVRLDVMPLLANGKIDMTALKKMME